MKSKIIIILASILFIVNILLTVFLENNIGVEFSSSKLAVVQIDHEVELSDFENTVNKIVVPSRITKESTGKFYVYFKDVEDFNKFHNEIKAHEGGIVSLKGYDSTYSGEMFILERIKTLFIIFTAIFFFYILFTFKGLGLRIIDLPKMLFVELFLLISGFMGVIGVASVMSYFGILIDLNFYNVFNVAIFLIIIFRIYTLLRFRDVFKKESDDTFNKCYGLVLKRYTREFVLIIFLVVLTCFLPFTLFGKDFVIRSMLILVSILISILNFFFVEKALFDVIHREKDTLKVSSKSKLNNKW